MRIEELSNDALDERVGCLLREEREVGKSVLLHLLEVERRGAYADQGHGDLRTWLIQHHGMEDTKAWRRATVVAIMRAFPLAAEYVERELVHESSLLKIAAIITEQNHREVLDAIAGLTTEGADDWVIRRFGLDRLRKITLRVSTEFIDRADRLRPVLADEVPDGKLVGILDAAMKIAERVLTRTHERREGAAPSTEDRASDAAPASEVRPPDERAHVRAAVRRIVRRGMPIAARRSLRALRATTRGVGWSAASATRNRDAGAPVRPTGPRPSRPPRRATPAAGATGSSSRRGRDRPARKNGS